MNEQLLEFAGNIVKSYERDKYKASNLLCVASIVQKAGDDLTLKTMIAELDQILSKGSKMYLGLYECFIDILIDANEISLALKYCHFLHRYTAFYGHEVEVIELIQHLCRIGSKCSDFEQKFLIGKRIQELLSRDFYSFLGTIEQQNSFFAYSAGLKAIATTPSQKQKITKLIRKHLQIHAEDKQDFFKKLIALLINGFAEEAVRLTKNDNISKALEYAVASFVKVESMNNDDASNLIRGIVASDLLSESPIEERKTAIYLLVLVAEKMLSMNDTENAEEVFGIANSQAKQYLSERIEFEEDLDEAKLFSRSLPLRVASSLHQNITPKSMPDILKESYYEGYGGNEKYKFDQGVILCDSGQLKKGAAIIQQALKKSFSAHHKDVFNNYMLFVEAFHVFLSHSLFSDALEAMLLFEKKVVPHIMQEGDDMFKRWWFDRLYYFFEGDDSWFHQLFSGLAESDKNPEKLIYQIDDDRVRAIGLIYLAGKHYRETGISQAIWTLKQIKDFPYDTALLHFIDQNYEQLANQYDRSEFIWEFRSVFPNQWDGWF
jgi:hypothetical protein